MPDEQFRRDIAFSRVLLVCGVLVGGPVFVLQWLLFFELGADSQATFGKWLFNSVIESGEDGGYGLLALSFGIPALVSYIAARLVMAARARRD